MAEQPISLDGADGVSPGAPNANAEGGDPVGEVVPIIGPRTTLASVRDPETVLYRVKHEQGAAGSMWSWRSPDESSDSTSYCSFGSIE